MLILTAQDIAGLISKSQLIASIEEAFLIQESKDFIMPQRMHIEQDENVLLLMPAFIKDYFATKLVSVFPENKKYNQPSIHGKLLLNDAKTGETLALIDAPKLTALRTAAVGAIAIKKLHKKALNHLGLIGAGIQGFQQISMAHHIHPFKQVFIFDPFISQTQKQTFRKNLENEISGIDCFFVDKAEGVLRNTEVIITTTTSLVPVLPENPELLKGKTYIAIGSFKALMRELPESIFSCIDQVFIDTPAALHESGDLILPLEKKWIKKEQIHLLGELLSGQKIQSNSETVVFKSVGMALFDLVVAKEIYKLALAQNVGINIPD